MTSPRALSETKAYVRLVGDDEPTPTPTGNPERPRIGRSRWLTWIVAAAAVALVAVLFWVGLRAGDETERADGAEARLDTTAGQAESLAANISRACRDGAIPIPYQGACAEAQQVASTDLRTPVDGVDGGDGRDGIDGTDGIDGSDGRDGQDGTDGGPGDDGTDGEDGIDGSAGLNGTSRNDGVDGIDGRDGTNGAPGVGIASTQPDPTDTCYRLVTYDDGRTERWGPFCAPPATTQPAPGGGATDDGVAAG